MNKWLVIRPDGIEEVEPAEDTLTQLQQLVGGRIEVVRIGGGKLVLVVNETGQLDSLPVNLCASRLYGVPGHVIVGTAVIGKIDLIDGVPDIVSASRAEWQTELFSEI